MNAVAKSAPRVSPRPTPQLRVVAAAAPKSTGSHAVRAILVSIVVLIAVVLVIASAAINLAVDGKPLANELKVLKEQNQALVEELQHRSSADWLVEQAKAQGLVPYAGYGYLNIETGQITGGTPAK